MGQSHSAGPGDSGKVNKVHKSYSKQRHSQSSKQITYSKPSLIKKAIPLQNIVRPNGYPPEILELIMFHMDVKTLLNSSMSCKLWMETSYQYVRVLYRQHFDATIAENDDMDYREEYSKLHKAKTNLIKGAYWPEIICSEFRSRSKGDLQWRFSTHNNDILYNTRCYAYDSYGSYIQSAKAVKYNLDRLEKSSYEFGCTFVGDTEVCIKDVEVSWNYKRFTVNPIAKRTMKTLITPELQDEYDEISIFKNLDNSNQVLLYHKNNTMEVYDTMTANLLLTQNLENTMEVLGFCKNCVVRRNMEWLVVIDLTTKEIKYKIPGYCQAIHYFDGKFAYGMKDTVVLMDLESGKKIHELKIDSSGLVEGAKDIQNVFGICFDKWKLVVAFMVTNTYHVVQIFDMVHDFKVLQTIHDPMCIAGNKTQISLLNNGAIVIGNTNLTVYHFDHPSISEKLTVAFYDDTSAHISMIKIDASDITRVALDKLNLPLDEVSLVTVHKPTAEHGAPFELRMTCVFKRQQEFSRAGFLSAVEGWPKGHNIIAPFALTANEVKNIPLDLAPQRVMYRACGFLGSCLLVFEEFDKQTEQWKFCKPVFRDDLEIFRPTVKKISVDYTVTDYEPQGKN